MAKSILKRLRAACRAVEADIRNQSRGSRFAAGISSEGYAGGYRDALRDVEAMLTHGFPADSRGYWDKVLQTELSKITARQALSQGGGDAD